MNSSIAQAGDEHEHEAVPALSLNSEGFILPNVPGTESSTAPGMTTFTITMKNTTAIPSTCSNSSGHGWRPARPPSPIHRRQAQQPATKMSAGSARARLRFSRWGCRCCFTHPCPRCSVRLELAFQPTVALQGVQAAVRVAPLLGFRRRFLLEHPSDRAQVPGAPQQLLLIWPWGKSQEHQESCGAAPKWPGSPSAPSGSAVDGGYQVWRRKRAS